jgi:hypothetical protein
VSARGERRRRVSVDNDPPALLVFARPSQEIDESLASLDVRSDLCLLRVATLQAAQLALRDLRVDLVIVCDKTEDQTIVALLSEIEAKRPGIPVLAVRAKQAGGAPPWRKTSVAVVPAPVMPDVLSRTVDVALRLRQGGRPRAGHLPIRQCRCGARIG